MLASGMEGLEHCDEGMLCMQRKDRFEGTRGLLFKALEAVLKMMINVMINVMGYDLPPVKKEVCAALRIILEEALIVDGEVLSTRLKTESRSSDRQKS
jgi:hypothetical protein